MPHSTGNSNFCPDFVENRDRVGVVDALERRIDEALRGARSQSLSDALGEELHVVRALVEHGAENVFEELLGESRVGGEIGEGDLRLDHPELGQVAAVLLFSARKVGPNV